jgi:hypothetical protein
VFREFAAAAARAKLKCNPSSMVGHRKNFCDLGEDVSVVGVQVNGPPGAEREDIVLEVHAESHGGAGASVG